MDGERVLDRPLLTTPRMHPVTSEAREPAAIDAVPPNVRQQVAVQHALLSAFVPGAAQLAQGRWVAGLVQFGVVAAYLAGVFAVGPLKAIWLAVFWNAYSAVEAYWYERD